MTRFSINYDDHKNSYDFANPIKLLEESFEVVNIKFITDGNKELVIKCSFEIRNYQPPPEDMNNVIGLYDNRYWSTPIYEGKFFNEFMKYSLKKDIKKKIIFNASTGSSWRFNQFDYISVTFDTKENQLKIVTR